MAMLKLLRLRGNQTIRLSRPGWGMIISVLVTALTMSALASAEAANFTVSLDRDTISLEDGATLTMTFDGAEPKAIPTLPSLPNLLFSNPSRSEQHYFSFDATGQKATSRITYSYSITATKPGDYIIPSMATEIGGRTFTTQPLKLTVRVPNPQNQLAFLKMILPKKEVFVGEVIQLELQLYVRDEVVNIVNFQSTPLQAEGFTVGAIGKKDDGPPRRTRVNNLGYNVVPFTMSVMASKAGTL